MQRKTGLGGNNEAKKFQNGRSYNQYQTKRKASKQKLKQVVL